MIFYIVCRERFHTGLVEIYEGDGNWTQAAHGRLSARLYADVESAFTVCENSNSAMSGAYYFWREIKVEPLTVGDSIA